VLGLSFGIGVMQPLPSLKELKNNPSISWTAWLKKANPVRIMTRYCNGIDVDCLLEKPIYSVTRHQYVNLPLKMMCSYRVLDIRFNAV
jgi:hypothetical protein